MRNAYSILVEYPAGKRRLGDLGVDMRIILKWIIRKYGGKLWTRCIWLRIGINAGSFERGYEPLGSIKGGVFLD
jgi:hypothetical protein